MRINIKTAKMFWLFLFAAACGVSFALFLCFASPELAWAWQDTAWAVLVLSFLAYIILCKLEGDDSSGDSEKN